MKITRILLTVLLGVFLIGVTVSAQNNTGPYPTPVPTEPPAPEPAPSVTVPEPSTLALLGIGLTAGIGYRILQKKGG